MMVKIVPMCLVFVLGTFLMMVHARPQSPYNYPAPSLRSTPTATLRASTSQSFGQSASSAQTYNGLNNVQTNNFRTSQQSYDIPSTSYGTPILRNENTGSSVSSSGSSGGIQQGYPSGAPPSRSYGSPEISSSRQAPSNRYIPQQEEISIQKHIYVHVAPPDEEEERQRAQPQQIPGQKHYKIIFIKTPSYNPPAPYIAQQQALQEEKTLVYVLVKKPEEAPEVKAQQVAPAKINKPEVYFIKYKSRGEQNVQQQVDNFQEDNESVVVESAAGRGASNSASGKNGGYNYDRPTGALD